MSIKNCRLGLYVAVMLGLSSTGPVAAQNAEPAPAAAPAVPDPAVPAAEVTPAAEAAPARNIASTPRSAPSDDISEVIVTARRVEERMQDVPISMTVFNQDQLTNRNVLSGRDLATYTPSLAVNGRYGTENAAFSLRGFSQEIRTTPSVAVYFADVVAPRGSGAGTPSGDGAGPGSFFDLQNVQVLKGPQGTLFGRNTTGGAILLVPQKPTAEVGGYAEQSFGNYGMMRSQAVMNTPISDKLRFRFGIDHNERDGYLNNTSGIGPDKFQDVNYTAARASLVWDVTPSLENYTIGTYSVSDTNGQVPRLFVCNPKFDPRRGPTGALGCAQLASMQASGSDGRFDIQSDNPNAQSRTDRSQLINTSTWLASDALTVKNIISYAELVNDLRGDLFGTDFFTTGTDGNQYQVASNTSSVPPGYHSTAQNTFTEELQLQGTQLDGRWVWQAGAYYESSKGMEPAGAQSPANINCTNSGTLDCYDVLGQKADAAAQLAGRPNGIGVGSVNWLIGTIDFRNLGIYAQSTYSLTDQLKATGGIRYTKDHAESVAETALRRFPAPSYRTPVVYCADPSSGHGVREIVASVDDCRVEYSQDSDAPTWVLGLDYQPINDVLLYGKYSRGYRQGSVQPFSAAGHNTYDPEKVDTYELGFKSSFRAPVRGTFNAALFYNNFTDQQLLFGFGSTNGASGNAAIINAGKSEIKGAEVELTLVPFHGMNFSISYAYLDTEVKKLIAPVPAPTDLYNIASQSTFEGDPLPYSTKHKLSSTASYTLPLDASIGQISIGATYSYQSPQFIAHTTSDFSSTTANPYGEIPAYSLVNMNLGWNAIAGSNVDAALFATNVLDREYRAGITNSWTSFGFETEIPGEPRMLGARVRVNFGS
ncbi:MAG: TonB-dependent receptor [Hydrocarboniphaga sp.]|uniref:TonB-dependent receptor n=1 Tax=Hydrocarboniphaga sp. TaxID=2033016 RepID=UPI002606109B|nr:TonB-dependent receptor [Hydrocarboniphaga sp.]MDB5968675.1 TonB-dependent receptor [Hydrocarboniphaga sp.]